MTKILVLLHQTAVFSLTFLSFAVLTATRKSYSNVKVNLQSDWALSMFDGKEEDATQFLGTVDSIFMFSYAAGLFFWGQVGDNINLRKVSAIGLCTSAVAVGLFGMGSVWQIATPWWYAIFWACNGLLQSAAWPAYVAVMANWFGKGSRGIVLGIWSANVNAGNILGALIATAVVGYGWKYAFLLPAALLFVSGLMIFLCLVSHPHMLGLPSLGDDRQKPSPLSKYPSECQIVVHTCQVACVSDESPPLYQRDAAAACSSESGTRPADGGGLELGLTSPAAIVPESCVDTIGVTVEEANVFPVSDQYAHNDTSTLHALHGGASSDDDDYDGSSDHGVSEQRATEGGRRISTATRSSRSSYYTAPAADANSPKHAKPMTIWEALFIPNVVVYSLSYACLKAVNFSLFFWLPFYLTRGLSWNQSEANGLSTVYDIGSVFGGMFGGWVSDRSGKRSPVVFFMILASVAGLILFRLIGTTVLLGAVLMLCCGALIGGPANLISSVISADVAKQGKVRDRPEALATVAGIIDGTASVGAAIAQELIPFLSDSAGWDGVFVLLTGLSLASALCLLHVTIQELRRV